MTARWSALAGLCAGLALACSCAAADKPAAPAGEDDDIREAVFRWQMEHHTWLVYFLSINGEDPPEEFMKRFADHDPPVKPKSACEREGGVHDKRTGTDGAILSVGEITRDGDSAVVKGSVFWSALNGRAGQYMLARKDGRWSVTEFRKE